MSLQNTTLDNPWERPAFQNITELYPALTRCSTFLEPTPGFGWGSFPYTRVVLGTPGDSNNSTFVTLTFHRDFPVHTLTGSAVASLDAFNTCHINVENPELTGCDDLAHEIKQRASKALGYYCGLNETTLIYHPLTEIDFYDLYLDVDHGIPPDERRYVPIAPNCTIAFPASNDFVGTPPDPHQFGWGTSTLLEIESLVLFQSRETTYDWRRYRSGYDVTQCLYTKQSSASTPPHRNSNDGPSSDIVVPLVLGGAALMTLISAVCTFYEWVAPTEPQSNQPDSAPSSGRSRGCFGWLPNFFRSGNDDQSQVTTELLSPEASRALTS